MANAATDAPLTATTATTAASHLAAVARGCRVRSRPCLNGDCPWRLRSRRNAGGADGRFSVTTAPDSNSSNETSERIYPSRLGKFCEEPPAALNFHMQWRDDKESARFSRR